MHITLKAFDPQGQLSTLIIIRESSSVALRTCSHPSHIRTDRLSKGSGRLRGMSRCSARGSGGFSRARTL